MHPVQLLVEVRDVAVEVAVPVQRQHLPHDGQRHPLGRRPLAASVEEAVIPPAFVADLPPAHLAVRESKDLSRLVPLQPSIDGAQDHLLDLHRPLHGGRGVLAWLHPGALLSRLKP